MSQEKTSKPGGLNIRSFGKSDIGKKRKNNQDAIFLSPGNNFFILADGMGGHMGGEEASRLAIEMAGRVFRYPESLPKFGPVDKKSIEKLSDDIARVTRAAILEADREVVKTSEKRHDLKGMGATIETLVIDNGIATIGHVGDSRVYRKRGGGLEQVTEDHSVLNEEMKIRKMTEQEIADFPFKNRIIRALGHLDDRRVDIHQGEIEQGDVFLMCSDGLTDVTSDKEIEKILGEHKGDPKGSCESLIQAALDGGGPDNVSVIVVEFD